MNETDCKPLDVREYIAGTSLREIINQLVEVAQYYIQVERLAFCHNDRSRVKECIYARNIVSVAPRCVCRYQAFEYGL